MMSNILDSFADRIGVITTTDSPLLPKLKTHLADVLDLTEDKYKVFAFPKVKPGVNTNDGGAQYQLWQVLTSCYNPDPVSVDISKSHLRVIEGAYRDGCQTLIVMEDDARFDTQSQSKEGLAARLSSIVSWLEQNSEKWDLFYFGCMVYPPLFNKPVAPGIDQTLFPMGSHAYAINRSGMKRVLANGYRVTQDSVPIDSYYRNDWGLRKFMAYPSLNNQCKPPAIYTKTARKLGVDLFLDYDQCCSLLEKVSHHSRSLLTTGLLFLAVMGLALFMALSYFKY